MADPGPVLFGQVPAVMHRWLGQPFVPVELEQQRHQPLTRAAGIDRRLGVARLDEVDDLGGVLNELAGRSLKDRLIGSADRGHRTGGPDGSSGAARN